MESGLSGTTSGHNKKWGDRGLVPALIPAVVPSLEWGSWPWCWTTTPSWSSNWETASAPVLSLQGSGPIQVPSMVVSPCRGEVQLQLQSQLQPHLITTVSLPSGVPALVPAPVPPTMPSLERDPPLIPPVAPSPEQCLGVEPGPSSSPTYDPWVRGREL